MNYELKRLFFRVHYASLGATPVSLGHVKIEVNSAVPGTNASQDSLVRVWALSLSAPATTTEETIFLSPLWVTAVFCNSVLCLSAHFGELKRTLLDWIFFHNSLNQTGKPLSVTLTSSLVDGGPVRMSICVFSSLCQYYNVKERRWSSEGLQPLEGSTLHAAHCLTQHLTMFGASLFVHPGAVVLLPPVGENTKHYTNCYSVHCAHLTNTWSILQCKVRVLNSIPTGTFPFSFIHVCPVWWSHAEHGGGDCMCCPGSDPPAGGDHCSQTGPLGQPETEPSPSVWPTGVVPL